MIFCTRIWETDQIFAHVENKSADMEIAMTFKQGASGNPHGNRHRTRHLLNQEFMQALLLHFRQHGKKAIEKVAREQPGVYLKILALLVPRETKIEHSGGVKAMSDEEIEQAIELIQTMLAARAGEAAKVIEGTAEPAALPAPNGHGHRSRA
jgi:Zn-dependent oligopeptidase